MANENIARNPSPARNEWIAFKVINERNLDLELALALTEALHAEGHYRNYANNGIRGPEDEGKGNARSTDAQLAEAAKSLALPHDAEGTDHASVGVMQQQVGPGFKWGTVAEAMDPEHAMNKFIDSAEGSPKRHTGAEFVAQSVQRSSNSQGTNYKNQEADSRAWLDRFNASCKGE